MGVSKNFFALVAAAKIANAFILHSQRRPLASVRLTSSVVTTEQSSKSPSASQQQDRVAQDAADDLLKETQQQTQPNDKFDWFKAWYPIVPVEILDPEIPHKFELLGMDLVVWKDAAVEGASFGPKQSRPTSAKRTGGEWRVFIDECPHRKVPLSEGRVEDDGSLLCSYHAWRFDGQGQLIDAPQLESNSTALDRIQANPKSRCNAFPAQVVDGVLWVWPQTGDDAKIESALSAIPKYNLPENVQESRIWSGPWNFRQLPYGADYFMENVVDPAHVEVSHHNVVGSRYNDQTRSMKAVSKLTKNGFAVESSVANGDNPATTTFTAPSLVSIETEYGKGAKQVLELYASPSRPGFCNHIGRIIVVKDESGEMPKLLRQFTLPLPTWLNHVLASAFLNQDALFLHHQERQLAKTGEYSTLVHTENGSTSSLAAHDYSKAILPIETDRGVVNYRNWIRVLAGGRIPYKYNPSMPASSSEVVFDVWNGHTKYCRLCQRALGNLKKARFAAFLAATCLAVLRPVNKTWSLAGTLAAAGVGLALNKLIAMFYRYEFSHGHND